MTRRPATFSQADLARAIRAAEQAAPGRYRVRLSEGDVIVEPVDE